MPKRDISGWVDAFKPRDLQDMLTRLDPRVDLSDMRSVGEADVFAVGSLRLAGDRHVGSFGALHRIDRGLIAAASPCLTDPDMIEYRGLIP